MAVNGILLGADTNSNKYLPLTGGTLTGALMVNGKEDNISYTMKVAKDKFVTVIQNNNKKQIGAIEISPPAIKFTVEQDSTTDQKALGNYLNVTPFGVFTDKKDIIRDGQLTHKFYVDNAVSAVKPKAHKVTLTVAGWADNQQTVTLTGVLADEDSQFILPTPAAASRTMYNDCDVQCIAQAADSLTFSCATVPTDALSVYILLMDVTLS